MKTRVFLWLIVITNGIALLTPQAFAGASIVNCDKGDSLQKAILSGSGSAAPIEIRVFGICDEEIEFTRDNVSIIGDGSTALIGHISIIASDQVQFTDLTSTGHGWGVTVFNGRTRFIRVNLAGNQGVGVYGRNGAAIIFVDSQISDNHRESGVLLQRSRLFLRGDTEVNANWGDGIVASQNSSASLEDATVNANQGSGIHTNLGSSVKAVNSQIHRNGAVGICMRTGSAGEIRDCAVSANGQQGLEVASNSTLDVYGGIVGWNGDHDIWVSEH